jgi:hypothetical protein
MINVTLQGAGRVPASLLQGFRQLFPHHIDFFQENFSRKMKLTSQDTAFGWAFIDDQTLRQLTYLAMAASVVFWS